MKSLQNYKSIGWDFDGTLIDHPNSPAFWEFILLNPYRQLHNIVTFRSGGMEDSIFEELKWHQSNLSELHFAHVYNVDHQTWADFTTKRSGIILLSDPDPYLLWKGETCWKNNIDVLIDDMIPMVELGCKKHNVALYHPDDLI